MAMNLDRFVARAKLLGYLFVQQTADDERWRRYSTPALLARAVRDGAVIWPRAQLHQRVRGFLVRLGVPKREIEIVGRELAVDQLPGIAQRDGERGLAI